EAVSLQTLADVRLPGGQDVPDGEVTIGLRAADLSLCDQGGYCRTPGRVQLAQSSGSATYVHADTPVGNVVAQVPGVQHHDLGDAATLHFSSRRAYVFGPDESLLRAPQARES